MAGWLLIRLYLRCNVGKLMTAVKIVKLQMCVESSAIDGWREPRRTITQGRQGARGLFDRAWWRELSC